MKFIHFGIFIVLSVFLANCESDRWDEIINSSEASALNRIEMKEGAVVPDSLGNNFSIYKQSVLNQIDQFNQYTDEENRAVTMKEMEMLFCNRQIRVLIHDKKDGRLITAFDELRKQVLSTERKLALISGKLQLDTESGFCMEELDLLYY